jgi:hypothetical protein
MITIDTVDDNNKQPARQVDQATPVVNNRRNGNLSAAYEAAQSYYSGLLRTAQQERQVRQTNSQRSIHAEMKHEVLIALGRIARALTAWL